MHLEESKAPTGAIKGTVGQSYIDIFISIKSIHFIAIIWHCKLPRIITTKAPWLFFLFSIQLYI
jgi:hypothetical protein